MGPVVYPAFAVDEPSVAGRALVTAVDVAAQRSLLGIETLSFGVPLVRVGNAVSIAPASSLQSGYLSAADWQLFNAKQPAIGYTPANDTNVVHKSGDTHGSLLANDYRSAINYGYHDVSAVELGLITSSVDLPPTIRIKPATLGAIGFYQSDGATRAQLQASALRNDTGPLTLGGTSSVDIVSGSVFSASDANVSSRLLTPQIWIGTNSANRIRLSSSTLNVEIYSGNTGYGTIFNGSGGARLGVNNLGNPSGWLDIRDDSFNSLLLVTSTGTTFGSTSNVVISFAPVGIDYCNVTLGQWNLRSDNTGKLKLGRSSAGNTHFYDNGLSINELRVGSNGKTLVTEDGNGAVVSQPTGGAIALKVFSGWVFYCDNSRVVHLSSVGGAAVDGAVRVASDGTLQQLNSARWVIPGTGLRSSQVGDGSGNWQTTFREEFNVGGARCSFYNAPPVAKQSVSSASPTLANDLLTALSNVGLIQAT